MQATIASIHDILKDSDSYFFSKLYYETENYKNEYDYYEKHHQLNEMLKDLEVSRQVAQMDARLELDKKEQENEILRVKGTKSEEMIEKKDLLSYSLLIVLGVLILLVYMTWTSRRKLKRANVELAEKNAKIAGQQEEIKTQNQDIYDNNICLEKRNKELNDLNNEKDTLMNIVAHDLKTPLSQIEDEKEKEKLINKIEMLPIMGQI